MINNCFWTHVLLFIGQLSSTKKWEEKLGQVEEANFISK